MDPDKPTISYEKDGLKIEVFGIRRKFVFHKNGLVMEISMDTFDEFLKELHAEAKNIDKKNLEALGIYLRED